MQNIDIKLEFWKNRLLDLGKRNRLINCPLPKDGKRVQRHSLLISSPASDDIWSMMLDSDDTLSFPVPLNKTDDEYETETESSLFTSGIQTNQTPNETYKTLRSLMKKAKEFTDEKGLNALHLAFGFLNWVENGTEGHEMRSPLLLVPVKLTQDDLFSPIILSRSDEEVSANFSLGQKLLNDFGIELPSFTEDIKLLDYLNDVAQAVKSLGWSITNDTTQLSLFSFMKINMYRDIERNAEKICEHHIIRTINGEALRDGTSVSDISDYNHDEAEPQDVFSVVDADSSQQDAILLAKRGASFVLQGPPGTGKSQTITNIIAELIADGKKVLFVSEKMAALEVVYKRLTQAGLAQFCLTLHSHNAKRREILDQCDKSIKMSRQKASIQQDAYSRLYRLKEVRNALNQYSAELHTVIEPLGQTIYQVSGYLSRHENFRNVDFVQADAENFTPVLLSQCETALEEVTRIVSKSGYQQDNPWNGCVLTQPPTFEFRQRFIVDADILTSQIENGIAIFAALNQILGTNIDWGFANTKDVQRIHDCVMASPVVPSAWVSLDLASVITMVDDSKKALEARNLTEILLDKFNTFYSVAIINLERNEQVPQEDTPVANYVNKYNAAFESHVKFLAQRKISFENQKAAETASISCEKTYANEKELCENLKSVWQSAQDTILQDFDVNIFSLDIADMLTRYRGEYRTFIRRIGGSYSKDRKAVLTHCKKGIKLTYEQGLSFLDSINDVLLKKAEYERQYDIANKAEILMRESVVALDETTETLNKTTSMLTEAESILQNEKQNLRNAVERIKLEYQTALNEKQQSLLTICRRLSDTLGEDINANTNYLELRSKLEWCTVFKFMASEYLFSRDFINGVCMGDNDLQGKLTDNLRSLKEWQTVLTPNYEKFASLFCDDGKNSFFNNPLKWLSDTVKNCKDNFASLEYLIDYRIAEKRLTELGINTYLMTAKEIGLDASEIVSVFKKCFFRSWLDAVMPRYSSIQDFRRLRQEERIALFKDLDKAHIEISKAIVISKLISRLPNFDAYSANGEISLLRREMAKQRKLMPTRLLIAALPNLLPALKPCVMMSPLSVSTYLGNSSFEFDTVIFDEASQVRTEDAVGAIFRAKQAIIAGDSKQLPPSDFFTSSISAPDEYEEEDDGEVNDAGAYESLLDEATMLPTQTLLWHYRSRHEHLIAFSNAKIYQGNLTTFPSSVENIDGMGVQYIHVQGGTYDRGGKNGNKAEAARVADLVFEHFLAYPKRSLGIIAFGEVQQSAILDALIEKRRANPTFEPFFKEDKEESLFIKNLETVQGDERDTIIFSIGYAPDATGKFIMNFGPLSRDGGERRLNVAVTRARYNLKLVGSIMPTDIDPERVSGQGPKLLRLYIDFAINGANAILGEISADSNGWFDSPFEASVHEFLIAKGFDVVTQVGCSGYRIDMAVRHPKYSGRFAIGIECDGAMYHSARTARERDRLRQTVLEDMGWKIYRIWSTDWIKDRHTEGERLLSAINDAINNYREIAPSATPSTIKMNDFLDVSTQTVHESIREGVQQKFDKLRSRYYGWQAKDIPSRDMAETMQKVLENDFGLDKAGVFKETALYGYGWERQGSKIKDKFDLAFRSLLHQRIVEETSDGKLRILNDNLSVDTQKSCPKCKTSFDKGDTFCGKCGSKL